MTGSNLKSKGQPSTVIKQIIIGIIAVTALTGAAVTIKAQRLPFVAFFLVAAYVVGALSVRHPFEASSDTEGAVQASDASIIKDHPETEVIKKGLDKAAKKKMRSLVKRNNELLVLYSLANVVASSLELSEVLSVALDGVAKIFGALAGEIAIIGAPEETIVMYYRGSSVLAKYTGSTAPRLTRKLPRQVAKTGEAIITNINKKGLNKKDTMIQSRGVSKIAVFPIKSKRHIIGTISIACSQTCNLDKTDQELLLSIGSMVGSAIENSQLYQRLKHISDTDPVTGLYNHRFIIKKLNSELRRASRYGHSVSVLMLDVDDFKQINDRYGHPFGDRALKKIALAAIAACRETDVVGRYGGDEFLLVLPETKIDSAITVSRRVRQYIQNVRLITDEPNEIINITASLGLAVYPGTCKNGADLIKAADRNLYLSKRAGGNQLTTRQAA